MYKQIPLAKTYKVVLVDDYDFYHLSQFSWSLIEQGQNSYTKTELNGTTVYMYQLILVSPSRNFFPDHIDGDGLNNQRQNLRLVTRAQNQWNRSKTDSDVTSQYKGVYYAKDRQKWRAQINTNGKRKLLGEFKSELSAARAYNKAATELHGEFAKLNEIPEVAIIKIA